MPKIKCEIININDNMDDYYDNNYDNDDGVVVVGLWCDVTSKRLCANGWYELRSLSVNHLYEVLTIITKS